MKPAPLEMKPRMLPYTCGVCTNATRSSPKNGSVSTSRSGSGTKSASRIRKKSPSVTESAWLMFPALAPSFPVRAR
jgi:hypothetical protein